MSTGGSTTGLLWVDCVVVMVSMCLLGALLLDYYAEDNIFCDNCEYLLYVYHKIFKYIKNLLITAEGKYLPHDQYYKNLMGNRCDN